MTRNQQREAKYRMIRVPRELADEIDDIAARMLQAYEEGRITDLEISERGGVVRVTHATVIARGLEMIRNKWTRSNGGRSERTTRDGRTVTVSVPVDTNSES